MKEVYYKNPGFLKAALIFLFSPAGFTHRSGLPVALIPQTGALVSGGVVK